MCRRAAPRRRGWRTPSRVGADLDYPQPLDEPSRLRCLSARRPWSTPRVRALTRAGTRAYSSPLSESRASLSKLARSPPDNDGEEASHFKSSPACPGIPQDVAKRAARLSRGETHHNAPRTMSRCYGDGSGRRRRPAAACHAIRGRSDARDRTRWKCIIKSRSSTL